MLTAGITHATLLLWFTTLMTTLTDVDARLGHWCPKTVGVTADYCVGFSFLQAVLSPRVKLFDMILYKKNMQ